MGAGTTLTNATGVYHVASRLAFAGLHIGLTNGRISDTDILVTLEGESSTAAVRVRTSGWALKREDKSPRRYEWAMGRKITHLNNPYLFVAFVDLKRMERMPDVFVVLSTELHGYCASLGRSERCRYRPLVEEIEPYRNRWDTLEDHLRHQGSQEGWFDREDFVEELDAEAFRLLNAENSTLYEMADDHFTAQELAEASALLRILFRHRKDKDQHQS